MRLGNQRRWCGAGGGEVDALGENALDVDGNARESVDPMRKVFLDAEQGGEVAREGVAVAGDEGIAIAGILGGA